MSVKSIIINKVNFNIDVKTKSSFSKFDNYIENIEDKISEVIEKSILKSNTIKINDASIDKIEIDLGEFSINNFLEKFESH